MTKELVSDKREKPVLDEQTFARLLEAAYVLQEHHSERTLNLELRADQLREQESAAQSSSEQSDTATVKPDANSDYSPTLAQIVETQRLIHVGHLDLPNAMALVAKRAAQITKSSGAAIAIVDGKRVRYQAAAGSSSLPCGTEVSMGKALCFSCFRTGQPFRCPDVNPEFLLDAEECQRRGIQSLIAVPVFHDAGIAGALELYFADTHAFSEPDVHTCQLMAGLITEAFTRDSQGAGKGSQAAERASMLEARGKLKPNVPASIESSTATDANASSVDPSMVATSQPFVCRKCSNELAPEEQFCGKCGSPRISESGPPSMQSKVASLRRMQEANQQNVRTPANGAAHQPPTSESLKHKLPHDHEEERAGQNGDDVLRRLTASNARSRLEKTGDPVGGLKLHAAEDSTELEAESPVGQEGLEIQATETAIARPDGAVAWSSAAKAKDFLEQLAVSQNRSAFGNFWNARRGDIYLAIAVILMAGVIRWGIWSSHSVNATGRPGTAGESRPRRVPDADLSMLDKFMISIGIAEPPDAPEYKGNPETQVWVDLHTALYYCPGAELYGKTPRGRFTSQRDAQLDQFEPAYRKACN
jgi:putative methionine-R-sulfoxide reductase with GAF domain